jgi:hypothetical protein
MSKKEKTMSNTRSEREAASRQWCMKRDADRGLSGADYFAGAIERLGGVEQAAKHLSRPGVRCGMDPVGPDTIRAWLATGVGHVMTGHVTNLCKASGVPAELIRLSPYRGRRLDRADLLAATQRAIETLRVRTAILQVRSGLDSMLRAVIGATATQECTDRNADKGGISLDRRTRARVKAFLRNAELEIKALQKEIDRYRLPVMKAVAS